MINSIESISTPTNEGVEELMELVVPKSGTQIVFAEGKFQKYFSVDPSTKAGISAMVTPHGLGGFSLRLFKSVPKHRGPDGALVFYDPHSPVAGRVFCKVTGE